MRVDNDDDYIDIKINDLFDYNEASSSAQSSPKGEKRNSFHMSKNINLNLYIEF